MIVTFFAVLAAPLVALWIGGILRARSDKRAEKLRIFGALLSLRHQPLSVDTVRMLNLIDAVFADSREVREAWSRYFAALNDNRNNNPAGSVSWDEKKRDLILVMARDVGLSKDITTSDILRTYQPAIMNKEEELRMIELDIRLAQAREKANGMKLPGWEQPVQPKESKP
jgi:hypothetical protein